MTLITVRTAVLLLSMMKPMFALLSWIILVESRGVPELGIKNVRLHADDEHCDFHMLSSSSSLDGDSSGLTPDTDPICEETQPLSHVCFGHGQSLALFASPFSVPFLRLLGKKLVPSCCHRLPN